MPLYTAYGPIQGGNSLIRCPICDTPDSLTIHSRSDGAGLTGRKRRCVAGHLFTTRVEEKADGLTQETVDGVAEPSGRFSRARATTYSVIRANCRAKESL